MKISPGNRRSVFYLALIIGLVFGSILVWNAGHADLPFIPALVGTKVLPTPTPTRTRTATTVPATETPTPIPTVIPTDTLVPTPIPTVAPTYIAPYPSAPLCPNSGVNHSFSLFHTLWDGVRGCHYDHEHGQNPFIQAVLDMFPNFDLRALLGGVEVGHTNPSSPFENTIKHGGFKWNVMLSHPQGCAGFQDSLNGVSASVVQYHNFGDYSVEAGALVHSTVSLLKLCNIGNPADVGYIYTVQFQSYGQRIAPYQGNVLPFPNQPQPPYGSSFGPYLAFDCYGHTVLCGKQSTPAGFLTGSANSIWTSNPTGEGRDVPGSILFRLLFRIRDTYQVLDGDHIDTYPLTFSYVCSSDGGVSYNPVGCRFNNATTQVQEVYGSVPVVWDNLPGFDSEPAVGHVTGIGFTSQFGMLDQECLAPGPNCFPIKLEHALVGTYGSVLVFTPTKGQNIVTIQPSRNIFFCGPVQCAETDPGAAPSGWIGAQN